MRYTLWRITRNHAKGDPADGTEYWESDVTYDIVPETKDDEFGEFIADESGSQDYNYTVGFKQLATFYAFRDIKDVKDLYYDELEKLGLGRCQKCDIIKEIERGENFTYSEISKEWVCRDCDYKITEHFITNLTSISQSEMNEKLALAENKVQRNEILKSYKVKTAEEERMDAIREDMEICPECQDLKMKGVIPSVCQYHLDKQFEGYGDDFGIEYDDVEAVVNDIKKRIGDEE
jgi:hypothetical protein